VGELLRQYRLRAGLTQHQAAERAGLGVRTLRDIEQNRVARPREPSLRQLADALGLSGTEYAALTATAGPARGRVEPLRVDVLGALLISRDGVPVGVNSALQRTLLGLLAVRAQDSVPVEEIVDVLWGERPPRSAQRLVHVYVGQLRTLLEPARARRAPPRILRWEQGGYRLRLGPGSTGGGSAGGGASDVTEFDLQATQARAAQRGGDTDLAHARYARALACWRGPAVADCGDRLRAHPAVTALTARRVAVALAYADLALDAGQFDEVADRLRPLTAAEPLDEALAARMILALAGRGQQAGALRLYDETRQRLADDLGVEPSPELREAHLRVLRQQVPAGPPETPRPAEPPEQPGPEQPGPLDARPAPAQLPAAVGGFTGRAEHVGWLDALLDAADAADEPVSAVITGTAGVGKTALAVHWARRVRSRFPHGQLFANLHGYAAGPSLRPIDVLSRFLRALGVSAEQVPTEVEEAAALYRSMVSDKRLLIVLDNASAADQVRPLLPGGTGCVVLVTSRDRLAGLVARDGARPLPLDVLTTDEARSLLGRLVGPDLVAAESDAAAELAALCARLPLALRIAAANLGDSGRPVATYATRLRTGNRLADLQIAGDREAAVHAAFDLSYEALPAPAQRLFRLLGLVPGPDVTAETSAALAGADLAGTRELLDRLAAAHLVDQPVPGRYTLHDLLRLYAADRAGTEEGGAAASAALLRLYDHYLHTADNAARLLYSQVLRLPLPAGGSPAGAVNFADDKGASAWLDAESPNILAAVNRAAVQGPRQMAWLLADTLRGYYNLHCHKVDWLGAAQTALAAAEAEGDLPAQAAGHLSLGTLHWTEDNYPKAIERFHRGLALAVEAEWAQAQGAIHGNVGALYQVTGQPERAAGHHAEALAIIREIGWPAGEAATLKNLSVLCLELGRLDEAAEHATRSAALFTRIGSSNGAALALGARGEACHALGRLAEAAGHELRALDSHRAIGHLGAEADARYQLAAIYRDTGRLDGALDFAVTALAQVRESGESNNEPPALIILASVHHRLGDHWSAIEHYQQALHLARATGRHHAEVEARIGLAEAQTTVGDHDAARASAESALTTARHIGYRVLEGQAHAALAAIYLHQAEPETAAGHAAEAVTNHRGTGHKLGEARALALLALARQQTGQPDSARELRQEALAIFTDIGAAEASGELPVPR
jgi:DNA-binding SARP family transcriptional activator/DNA-binding XRE family transcriptional regulator